EPLAPRYWSGFRRAETLDARRWTLRSPRLCVHAAFEPSGCGGDTPREGVSRDGPGAWRLASGVCTGVWRLASGACPNVQRRTSNVDQGFRMSRYPDLEARAADIIARYAEARSAVMPLRYLAISQDGHLTDEGMEWVA